MLYIGIVALGLLVALLGYIATRPERFRVQRTTVVAAPASEVFAVINDLSQWGRWSPYDHRDPEMKKTYSGPQAGVGAQYAWEGNNQVGAGKMTVVESKPGELVGMKLEFSRPFKCCNDVNFVLEPVAQGTQVSWIMDGKNTTFSKAMSLVMSMDKMVGKDFEQGLANLNQLFSRS